MTKDLNIFIQELCLKDLITNGFILFPLNKNVVNLKIFNSYDEFIRDDFPLKGEVISFIVGVYGLPIIFYWCK